MPNVLSKLSYVTLQPCWLVFLAVASLIALRCGTENSKRLLLNDPDYITSLDQIKSKFMELESEMNTTEQTIKNQADHINGFTYKMGWCFESTLYAPWCYLRNRTRVTYTAEIFGAEYENGFSSGTQDKDVPCAVCKPNAATSVLMIPGRNKCILGWNEEYHGYIVASYPGNANPNTYICVDENEDVMDAGAENQNGYVFHLTRARCGSLKCPPYVEGKIITCVVCSQ